MKKYLILIFCSIHFLCNSQSKVHKRIFKHYWPAIDIGYGYRSYNSDFYGQLNTLTKVDFSKPVKIVGLGLSNNFFGIRFGVNRQLYFNYILPQSLNIQDTINCKISGFISSLSTSRTIFKCTANFHLYLGVGINAGRLKLQGDVINKSTTILTPKLILTPSYYTKYFFIGLTTEYEYDFLNFNWKNRSNNKLGDKSFIKLPQTCLTMQLRLGFYLNFRKTSK